MTPASRKRNASERRMERERDMRAKEAKTGVAHEASSRREGGTVRPDRRERVRKIERQRVGAERAEGRDAKHH